MVGPAPRCASGSERGAEGWWWAGGAPGAGAGPPPPGHGRGGPPRPAPERECAGAGGGGGGGWGPRGGPGGAGGAPPRLELGRCAAQEAAALSVFHWLVKKSLTALHSSFPEAYWARCWPSCFLKSWLGKVWKAQVTG